MSVHEIEAWALRLPRHERARLVQHLIASLDEDDEAEQAWVEEAQRRDEDLRTGKIVPISAAQVFAEARASSE